MAAPGKMNPWLKKAPKVVVITALLCCAVYFGLHEAMVQMWDVPFVYRWKAPNQSQHCAIFSISGFVDRGMTIFVRDPLVHPKTQWLGQPDWDGMSNFHDAVWSKDGSVLAIRIALRAPDEGVVSAYGYDFREHRALAPQWQSRSSTDRRDLRTWQAHGKKIDELLTSRGGASGRLILEDVQRDGHRVLSFMAPGR